MPSIANWVVTFTRIWINDDGLLGVTLYRFDELGTVAGGCTVDTNGNNLGGLFDDWNDIGNGRSIPNMLPISAAKGKPNGRFWGFLS